MRRTARHRRDVIKKRSGSHENTIRELSMDGDGITVGEPLVNFEGVMTGVPRFIGGEMRTAQGRP